MATKPKSKAVSTSRISFESEVFHKKDLPTKLKTVKGRAAEGVWGLQELQINGEDFAIAFGRTWEGTADSGAVVLPIVKKVAAKKTPAKKITVKK